jgi:hypothetical protein
MAYSTNMEAYLGQLISTINRTLCTYYRNSAGVWALCVLVSGFFFSSYTNYYYNNKGVCYSLSKSFGPTILFLD